MRIYSEGVGLTWSTITDMVDDDKGKFKDLVMDLLEEKQKILDEIDRLDGLKKEKMSDLNLNQANIKQTLELAKRRFNLDEIKFCDNNKIYTISNLERSNIENLSL